MLYCKHRLCKLWALDKSHARLPQNTTNFLCRCRRLFLSRHMCILFARLFYAVTIIRISHEFKNFCSSVNFVSYVGETALKKPA